MHRPLAFLVVTAAVVACLAGCGGGGSSSADIAFVSSRDGDYAIYVMSADGKGERRLSEKQEGVPEGDSVFFQIDPAWSPDATKIAYASVRAGSPDIYVMNADGTGTTPLTSRQDERHASHLVPDGKSIAFVRDGDIYVMGSDGSSPQRISDIDAQESDPAWSPDGEWLAYVRRTPGTPVQNLWLMHPDGSARHALTRQTGRTFTPAWSPDSKRIVFSMNREELLRCSPSAWTERVFAASCPRRTTTSSRPGRPTGRGSPTRRTARSSRSNSAAPASEKLTDNATNDSSPTWNPQPSAGGE